MHLNLTKEQRLHRIEQALKRNLEKRKKFQNKNIKESKKTKK